MGLRILVCAYDFPPIRSPQSLRVDCLIRELVAAGHQVVVLTRSAGAVSCQHDELHHPRVVRAGAGWFEALLCRGSLLIRALRRLGKVPEATPVELGDNYGSAPQGSRLNWKGRLVQRAYRVLDMLVFPDNRSLWVSPAIAQGNRICAEFEPDVIIGSHEPAAGLMVAGALSEAHRIPWIAELGDPVLAPYTLPRWHKRAFAFEAMVMRSASAVVVTSEGTERQLRQRHQMPAKKMLVLPQGFGGERGAPLNAMDGGKMEDDFLHVVYTGRFYPFRNPANVVRAVNRVPGVVFTVAGPSVPAELAEYFNGSNPCVRFLGELSHADSVALQRSADVLLSIGNSGTTQMPGKLMEYLGSGRPIMHVSAGDSDMSAAFVVEQRCGFVAADDSDELAFLLSDLLLKKRNHSLPLGLKLGEQNYLPFRWDSLAARLADLCGSVHEDWQSDHGRG